MGCGAAVSKLEETLEARYNADTSRMFYDEEFDPVFKAGLLAKLNVNNAGGIASLREISLSGRTIGMSTTLASNAAMLLNCAPYCTKVNLSNTGMDGVAFVRFVDELENHAHLASIDLHSNHLDQRMDQKRVGVALAALVGKFPACQGTGQLMIQDCGLSKTHIQAFAKTTEDWKPGMLPEIFLAGNDLGGGEPVGKSLAEVFNLCPRAKHVSISRCNLDVTALEALAEHFNDHFAVIEVDVLNNQLGGGDKVGEALGILMNHCPTTHKLFSYRCGLDGPALEGLAGTLEPTTELETIDLSNDELFQRSNSFKGTDAGRGLAEILAKCPAVTTLDIRHCGFDMDAADALLETGEVNYSMNTFMCFDGSNDNSYSYELAERLQEHFVCATFC